MVYEEARPILAYHAAYIIHKADDLRVLMRQYGTQISNNNKDIGAVTHPNQIKTLVIDISGMDCLWKDLDAISKLLTGRKPVLPRRLRFRVKEGQLWSLQHQVKRLVQILGSVEEADVRDMALDEARRRLERDQIQRRKPLGWISLESSDLRSREAHLSSANKALMILVKKQRLEREGG